MTALIIAVYLIGCVVAYLLLRHDVKRTFDEWTVGGRRNALCMSIFSWVAFLTAVIIYIISQSTEDDRPAKW